MKRSKILALLLSFAMLFTMSPSIAMPDVNAAAEGAVPVVTAAEATGWQPKPTRTVSGASA